MNRRSAPFAAGAATIVIAVLLAYFATQAAAVLAEGQAPLITFRWIFLLLGAGSLGLTAYGLVWAPRSRQLPVVMLGGFASLITLGLWSDLSLERYRSLAYPIAAYLPLPTASQIGTVILRDGVAFLAWAYGMALVGGRMKRRQVLEPARAQSLDEQSHRLRIAAHVLFAIGFVGSAVLVASTRTIAIFERDIDTVRYAQGSSLGFATLLQFCLVPTCVLYLVVFFMRGRRDVVALLLGLAAITLLVMTRAERSPLILVALGALFFARRDEIKLNVRSLGVVVILLVVLSQLLGLLRLQSERTERDPREGTVRALLDVSPELRERAFLYEFVPDRKDHLGFDAVPALTLSVLPGRVLSLVGVQKKESYTDSSRIYSQMMRDLGYYETVKPIRVGITGELWLDGGWLALIVGMFFFGTLVSWLNSLNPADPILRAAAALASAYVVFALITPLGALLPIAMVTLLSMMGIAGLVSRRVERAAPYRLRNTRSVSSAMRGHV